MAMLVYRRVDDLFFAETNVIFHGETHVVLFGKHQETKMTNQENRNDHMYNQNPMQLGFVVSRLETRVKLRIFW